MEIKLIGWESKGFRCPDVKVDLSKDGQPFDLCFIQMPNGTGKTTTLTLLKACLTGNTSNWSKDDIYQLKKQDYPVEEGKFTTNLSIDGQILTITLIADFNERKISYSTTSPQSGGIQRGWVPPNQLARFLNEEFIKLFIFDAELADKLLDDDYNEASKAIDALFQLYLLDEIKIRLHEYWDQQTEDVPRKSKGAITKEKKKLSELKERKAKLERKYKSAVQTISKNEERIEEIQQEVTRRISQVEEFRKEYNEALANLEKLKGKIVNKSQESFQLLRNPASIHGKITDVLIKNKNSLDNLQLPANTSRQFFEELAGDDNCVCGRPIGIEEEKTILKKADEYLSNEVSGFLNTFKSEVEELNSASFHQEALEDSIEKLDEDLEERDELEGRIRHIQNKLKNRGDEELKKLEKEQVQLEGDNKQLEDLIQKFENDTETNTSKTMNISFLEDKIENIDEEIKVIAGKVDLKNKIDFLNEILDQVKLLSKEKLKSEILDKFRKRLIKTLEYNPVSIDSIDGSIKLENQQSGASVGQTLSIAYCFLTTLLQWGAHSFPLVVDSPAGSLDLSVRRQVAGIIPNLTDQFVAFTISSERQGFVNEMKENGTKTIKSLTVLRKSDFSENIVNDLNPKIEHDSIDGFVIDDEDFFNNIDIEEEVI